MAKRIKEVYPTDQVFHLWAHQTQERARNGSNVRFEGSLLFSYTTVIAQLETDPQGQLWAFLSSESLTPTTAKHVSSSKSATSHISNRISTPAFADRWSGYRRNPTGLLKPLAEELTRKLAAMPRLRANLPFAVVDYEQRRASLIACATAFKVAIETPPEISQELRDKARTYHDRQEAENAEERRRHALDMRAGRDEDRPKFEAWLAAGAGRCPASFSRGETEYITVSGDKVRTSLGAEAPLEHVRKAIRFYESRELPALHFPSCDFSSDKTRKCTCGAGPHEFTPYHTNGHRIPLGNFTLDSIDEAGNVKAGCHFFSAAEIARFIQQWREVLDAVCKENG